jgi:tRNA-splicing ligase RtcB (3'-phosphate/5'-hydroxy nucleic acid ligase)
MMDYLHDIKITQKFAQENRMEIASAIFKHMGWTMSEVIESVHNYIDTDAMILRKGAISCKGYFLVPLNMRDGTLLCFGDSNEEWNNSAPHGAGRSMSRSRAKRELSVEDFKDTMKDVWSASVNESTLDEAPDAYKPAEEIKSIVASKYQVVRHLKPLFNFKSQE